jgi:hypothetical protein
LPFEPLIKGIETWHFYSKLGHVMIKVLLAVRGIALMVMMTIVVGNSIGQALFWTPIFRTIEIAGLAGVVLVAAPSPLLHENTVIKLPVSPHPLT